MRAILNVITRYNVGMELKLRRIGNSLGVILPRETLREWGVAEGDSLELAAGAIRPAQRGNAQARLDRLKRLMGLAIVERYTPDEIRKRSKANLARWKKSGVWGQAYDEWSRILNSKDDGPLFAAMVGADEEANRLRQSPPFTGLLSEKEMGRLREKAAA